MPDHERAGKEGVKYKRKQAERNKNREGDKEKAARAVRENSKLTVSRRNRRRDEKRRKER